MTMNIHSHSKYLHSCSKRTCIFLLPMHRPPHGRQLSAQAGRTETHNTPWKSLSYEGSRSSSHSHSKTTWKTDPGNVLKPSLLKLLWFILTMDTSCFWFHWQSTPQAFLGIWFTGELQHVNISYKWTHRLLKCMGIRACSPLFPESPSDNGRQIEQLQQKIWNIPENSHLMSSNKIAASYCLGLDAN